MFHRITLPLMMVELKIELPDMIAAEAKAKGLLQASEIERLLQAELTRSRVDRLFASADRLAVQGGPILTAAEVEQEIAAARVEKRVTGARSR